MEDRIYVGWPGGYYVTSVDPDFHKVVQAMTADLGPPTVVEFRAADEGYIIGGGE